MKIKTTDQLWNDAIQPVVTFMQKNRGATVRLIATMSKQGGREFNRQQVESYLAPDVRRRAEPRLGIGLAIMRAYEQVKLEKFIGTVKVTAIPVRQPRQRRGKAAK